jgi:hypothetical protein
MPYPVITVTDPLHSTCAAPSPPAQRVTSWWACL